VVETVQRREEAQQEDSYASLEIGGLMMWVQPIKNWCVVWNRKFSLFLRHERFWRHTLQHRG
jgi:hypothetical protein